MQNHELSEIDASLQAIVRRAYDLGRTEALKKVVDVLSAERPAPDQLALMAPDGADAKEDDTETNGVRPTAKPWWAWPVR